MHLQTLIAKFSTDKPPEWITLFSAGWGQLADGIKFFVDTAAFDMVAAGVAERGNEIVFDYEHQTLGKTQAPAAGWIKEIKWEDGVGIRARVEWTDKAAAYITAREYRYFSPVYGIRKSDSRVCYLHSVALTNTPRTKNLNPILAKLGLGDKENKMDKEKLIKELGLPADASDADIQAAVAKLGVKLPEEKTVEVEKEVVAKDVIAALELDGAADTSTVVASIHALKQGAGNTVTKAEFEALQAKLADREAQEAVAAAIAKGKITPAQKEWATTYARQDLPGFNTFVAKAPQVIPVDKLPGHKTEPDTKAQDEATMQVAAMMGLEKEDLEKYGEVTNG